MRCTSQFLTHQTPLSQSLAKEASDLSLNSEQIKRAIEATNTLAYLKTLEKSASDRTTEFPVADYNEVIRIASVPESLIKEASFVDAPAAVTPTEEFKTEFPELSQKEIMIGLHKEASINDRALEDCLDESKILAKQLVKLASEIKQDPQALDKLSATVEHDFEKVAYLVFGEPKQKTNTVRGMFKEAGLSKVELLASLYKEANELVAEIRQRQEWQKQAQEVFEQEKQAGLASWAAGKIGAGIGKVVGPVVKAPFKGAAAGARFAGAKVNNAVANTSVGKALTMKKIEPSKTTKRVIGAGTVLAGAAIDASMYKPKVNPNTGNGGDIWDKMNG